MTDTEPTQIQKSFAYCDDAIKQPKFNGDYTMDEAMPIIRHLIGICLEQQERIQNLEELLPGMKDALTAINGAIATLQKDTADNPQFRWNFSDDMSEHWLEVQSPNGAWFSLSALPLRPEGSRGEKS